MQFDVISLFPDMFRALTDWGITSRAAKQQVYTLRTWNPRDFTTDNYRTVDDRPYGGGPGMVMLAKPLEAALDAIQAAQAPAASHVVLLSPQGKPLTHKRVMELAMHSRRCKTVSSTACSTARTTRGRKSTKVCVCPMCCWVATMPRSRNGAASRRW